MKSEKLIRESIKISFITESEMFEFFKTLSLLGIDEPDSNGNGKMTKSITISVPSDQINFNQSIWNGDPFSPEIKCDPYDIKKEYLEKIENQIHEYGFGNTQIESVKDLEIIIFNN